jgi:hypothetical protein
MKCPKCSNTEPDVNGINCLDCNAIMIKDMTVEVKSTEKETIKEPIKSESKTKIKTKTKRNWI